MGATKWSRCPTRLFPWPARRRDRGQEVQHPELTMPHASRARSHRRARDGVGREPLLHRTDGVVGGSAGVICARTVGWAKAPNASVGMREMLRAFAHA